MAIEWKKIAFVEDVAAQSVMGNPTGSSAVASAITVAEQTLVGRVTGGNVDDLSVAQVQTLLGIGGATVSDTAYAASWDGVTDVAPSKNAVFDKIELLAPKDDPVFTGVVSASEQPLFVAYVTSTQSNVTGDGTAYNITGEIWTEQIDVGGCFSNGVFTAPVAGLYLFSGDVSLLDANAPDLLMTLETTGPLIAYVLTLRKAQYVCTSIAGGHFPFCAQVWLDASDTAYICVKLTHSPSDKKVDVVGGYNQTKFAGYLLP